MNDSNTHAQQLCDALALACQVHRDQLDLAGEPYILHVMRVVLECEGEELQAEARIVAALHDVVEDGIGSHWWIGPVRVWHSRESAFESLSERFSIPVVNAVSALTRRDNERYTDYITRVLANPLARIVKRADLIDNLRWDRKPIGESAETTERRRVKYRAALARISAAQDDTNAIAEEE